MNSCFLKIALLGFACRQNHKLAPRVLQRRRTVSVAVSFPTRKPSRRTVDIPHLAEKRACAPAEYIMCTHKSFISVIYIREYHGSAQHRHSVGMFVCVVVFGLHCLYVCIFVCVCVCGMGLVRRQRSAQQPTPHTTQAHSKSPTKNAQTQQTPSYIYGRSCIHMYTSNMCK